GPQRAGARRPVASTSLHAISHGPADSSGPREVNSAWHEWSACLSWIVRGLYIMYIMRIMTGSSTGVFPAPPVFKATAPCYDGVNADPMARARHSSAAYDSSRRHRRFMAIIRKTRPADTIPVPRPYSGGLP